MKAENKIPVPKWYEDKALPILKKLWQRFIDAAIAADAEQAKYYNSVIQFEKIKKVASERQKYESSIMPFGTYLYAAFGFVTDFENGIPVAWESSIENIKRVIENDRSV